MKIQNSRRVVESRLVCVGFAEVSLTYMWHHFCIAYVVLRIDLARNMAAEIVTRS